MDERSKIGEQIVQAEEEISKRSTGMSLKDNRNIAYGTLAFVVVLALVGIFLMYAYCPKTSDPLVSLGIINIYGCH